ncbi:MAG: isoprenylcysteine carboxylmethyltransferase family protein [Sphingobacteriales bacterium]|jgi:protein-S-isoprenylcysteine O-methyltransferase Ste14|nr:isoprenylcysteine carboxylmethyltransferase family protein [Sphingobacteriales bacterium]
MEYLVTATGWMAYFALHSILASRKTKEWVKGTSSVIHENYRILYNIISIIGLVLLMLLTFQNPVLLFKAPYISSFIGFSFAGIGTFVLLVALMTFDLKEFIGIAPRKDVPAENGKLIITGIYQYVRHPLYTGVILQVLGAYVLFPYIKVLIASVILIVYILIGSKLEEVKLIDEFGEEYISYKKKVKGLIPYIF